MHTPCLALHAAVERGLRHPIPPQHSHGQTNAQRGFMKYLERAWPGRMPLLPLSGPADG